MRARNLTLTIITLTLILTTGLAQEEPWWNTQYQCRAKIENVQPGDNHITPFVDLDYLATLCNITKVRSWTIIQNGKQLPTYSYGPDQEKTIIFTTTPEQNTISKHWSVTNRTGGKGKDKASIPYKTTNQNGTLTITTAQTASDWTTYYPQTYAQYTITKNMYLPKPKQIQKITLTIEHQQPRLTASDTSIRINGKRVYKKHLDEYTTQKTLIISIPTEYLKKGNNQITITIKHTNFLDLYRGGITVYQKTTIHNPIIITKNNQTVTPPTTTPKIGNHWNTQNQTGKDPSRPHALLSSHPKKITQKNGTITITTDHRGYYDGSEASAIGTSWAKYTLTQNIYIPDITQIQYLNIDFNTTGGSLWPYSKLKTKITIFVNNKRAYHKKVEQTTHFKAKIPSKHFKNGPNQITIKITHVQYRLVNKPQTTTIYNITFTTKNQTQKTTNTQTTAWLYYTDKKLPPGPTYQPKTTITPPRALDKLTGYYYPCFYSVASETQTTTISHYETTTAIHVKGKLRVLGAHKAHVYVTTPTKTKEIFSRMYAPLITFHRKLSPETGENPKDYITQHKHITVKVRYTSSCYIGGEAEVKEITVWTEYVPSNPTQITNIEKYAPVPPAPTNQIFQPAQGTKQKNNQKPAQGTTIPILPITSAAAAAYAYHTLLRKKQAQLDQKIRALTQAFRQTIAQKTRQHQRVSDADYSKFWKQIRALKNAFAYWKKWLAPVPEWLYKRMNPHSKNIFYRPHYIKHRLNHPTKYGKPYANLIQPDGTTNTKHIQQTIKHIQNTTYPPTKTHKPTKPHWPTTIHTPNNTYHILTPITPNTTQIIIQNTRTGQLYTLPIQTNPKNKTIKYDLRNKKEYKYKITITLPDGSTIKHNNTQALQQYLKQKITPNNKIKNYTQTPTALTITLQDNTTITLTKPSQAFLEWFQKILQYPSKYQNHPYNKFTLYYQTAQWQKAATLLTRHWQQKGITTSMTTQETTQRLQMLDKLTPNLKQIWNNPTTLQQLTQQEWKQTHTTKEENKENGPREEFRQKLNAKQASLKEYQEYLNTVEKIYGTKYASKVTIKVDANTTALEGIKIRIWNRYTQTTILDTTGHFTKELPQEGKTVPPDSTQQFILPPGTYNIQIDAPRHASQIHQITILDGEHTTITTKLKELYPPPRTNTPLDPIIDLISGRRPIQKQLRIEQQTNWLADNLGQDPLGTGRKTIIIWPGTETIITKHIIVNGKTYKLTEKSLYHLMKELRGPRPLKNGEPNTRLNQIKMLFNVKTDEEVLELIQKTLKSGKIIKKDPQTVNFKMIINGKEFIVGVDPTQNVIKTVIGKAIR